MSYEPLNICSWRRAIVLLMKGKAEEVEHNGKLINHSLHMPTVIRLRNYVIVPYREIPLSRKNVLHRDDYTCQYCGKSNTSLTVDHIQPKSRGGLNSWDNVVAACLRCNNKKGNKTLKESDMKLIKTPIRPKNRLHFEITKNHSHQHDWCKYL